jgi:integrase
MKISLRKRKLKSGKVNLSIEFYKGSEISPEGKRRHNREYENLKKFLYDKPKNASEKKKNKENLLFAEKMLAIRQAEYYQGRFNLKNTAKAKRRFLDYFYEKADEKSSSKKNYGTWTATLVHLKRHISPNTTFENVDLNFVNGVRNYFDNEAKTKSKTALSLNTKYTYFNKFKASLRSAFNEGYLSINYAAKVKSFEQAESQREYLTHKELQSLANAECKYPVVKRAFIFSCLSGIRWSDIHKLLWAEVRDEQDSIKIHFIQKKTHGVEYLYISKQARELLGERKSLSERVFVGLKYGGTYNTEILRWCMRAGITKHITFHSARHTNAVLLLENGADIYTVSKRLGHKELRTTEIYAKIVDIKNKEASTLIPEIKF